MNIYFVSLGCDKNFVDSEKMLGTLSVRGYSFTETLETADIAVVNTCCFVKDAQTESVQSILELADLKKEGQLKALIVTGCLAQRYRDDIYKEVPEVDMVLGTTAIDGIADAVDEVLKHQAAGPCAQDEAAVQDGIGGQENTPTYERLRLAPLDRPEAGGGKRILTTGTCTEYLKIAEGCSKWCTYCVIPSIRGPYRSVPMEKLVEEAKELAEKGIKELILVAQETTIYGVDLYGEKMLPELLRRIAAIDGIEWIRILYCYPEEITDELIDVIAGEPKVLHYLDMPIQHASDPILKKMGRHTSRRDLEEIIGKLREKVPDICIRTTLISGFPTETEADHKHLVAFVRKMKFDRLGVFTYSKEDGTPAAKMKPQIRASEKKRRMREIMEIQQEIAFRKAKRMKGRELTALIEGRIAAEEVYDTAEPGMYVYTARTYKDAPDIDGLLFMESPHDYMSGDLVRVRIIGSKDYDLIGEIV